jgi:hypothetical protein
MKNIPPVEERIKKYTQEQSLAMVLQDALLTDRQTIKE